MDGSAIGDGDDDAAGVDDEGEVEAVVGETECYSNICYINICYNITRILDGFFG